MKKALIIAGAAIILFGCNNSMHISFPPGPTDTIPPGYIKMSLDPGYHPISIRIIDQYTSRLPPTPVLYRRKNIVVHTGELYIIKKPKQ